MGIWTWHSNGTAGGWLTQYGRSTYVSTAAKKGCSYTHGSTDTKNVIASIFGSVHSPFAFITNRRLIVSVEHGGKVLREIFKAIMVAQFVTPSESRLCEKSFSGNVEQVHSPLISLLLDGCRGVRLCVRI